MSKVVLSMCIVLTSFFCSKIFAQENREEELIDFFSQKKTKVNVIQDWSNDRASIIVLSDKTSDTLVIDDVAEIVDTKVMLNKFLIISYRVRAGSGRHLQKTKAFIISKQKVVEAISIVSKSLSYNTKGKIEEGYFVTLYFSSNQNGVGLSLKESYQLRSNSQQNWTHFIKFDIKRMLFYNFVSNNRQLRLCDKETIQENGKYYEINLKIEQYINFKECWYQKAKHCYAKM